MTGTYAEDPVQIGRNRAFAGASLGIAIDGCKGVPGHLQRLPPEHRAKGGHAQLGDRGSVAERDGAAGREAGNGHDAHLAPCEAEQERGHHVVGLRRVRPRGYDGVAPFTVDVDQPHESTCLRRVGVKVGDEPLDILGLPGVDLPPAHPGDEGTSHGVVGVVDIEPADGEGSRGVA